MLLVGQQEGIRPVKSEWWDSGMVNEEALTETLNDLFDVAHQDALHIIKIEEDKQIVICMGKCRFAYGPVDDTAIHYPLLQ